jgi:hypothetical protein
VRGAAVQALHNLQVDAAFRLAGVRCVDAKNIIFFWTGIFSTLRARPLSDDENRCERSLTVSER